MTRFRNTTQRLTKLTAVLLLAVWQVAFSFGPLMHQQIVHAANNGTLKVHESGTASGTESNDPKVCEFNFEGFDFDANQTGYIQIDGQGLTTTNYGPYEIFGPADGTGYYATPYFNDGTGPTISDGQYKATLYGKNGDGSVNTKDEKAKSKVFKVACQETPTGSITITKVASPTSEQDFAFTTTGAGLSDFSLDDDGNAANTLSNSKTFSSLADGDYTVTESGTTGWALDTIDCGQATGVTVKDSTVTIALADGENVSCTFTNKEITNEPQVGSVQVLKQVDEGEGYYSVGADSDFKWGLDDGPVTRDMGTTVTNVSTGSHSVTENVASVTDYELAGWFIGDGSCTDVENETSLPADITVSEDQTTTITFCNQIKEDKKIALCHATGSETNPFVKISVSPAGAYNGHYGANHQNGEDVIPPFTYKGQTYSQNWPSGQAFFENNCSEPQPQSKIEIIKSSDKDVYSPGETVTYTFKLTNTGDVPLYDVQVTDPLSGLSTISGPSDDVNNDGVLSVDETWTFTATYTIPQDYQPGTLSNTATACGSDTQPTPTILTQNVTSINLDDLISPTVHTSQNRDICDDDEHVITVVNAPIVLNLAKTNNRPDPTTVGDTVTYTLTVTLPTKSGVSYNSFVSDLPPEGFVYVHGSWTAVVKHLNGSTNDLKENGTTPEPGYGSPGTWFLGTLLPGDVVTLTYQTVIQNSVNAGTYPDLAFASGCSITTAGCVGGTVAYSNIGAGANDPFVGTHVTVVVPQVLGASTTRTVLVNTGTQSAFIQLFAGLILALALALTFRTEYSTKGGRS